MKKWWVISEKWMGKNGTFCKLLIMRSIIGDARY